MKLKSINIHSIFGNVVNQFLNNLSWTMNVAGHLQAASFSSRTNGVTQLGQLIGNETG
ncbi:MAG: hypothetical protein IPF93_15745 [Saprospiraceae bacterium]|nr:hypothetical protein [Saprospiraceae bacterium]